MPAYRSESEAEIRDAVVARIRQHRPQARIIHEINVSTYGPNRIDVMAVDRAEIISVEIKSAKDKLDRLETQMQAMQAVSHHAIAALHEKFLVEQSANRWVAHYERDGTFYLRTLPDIRPLRTDNCWVYPETRRAMQGANLDFHARWSFPNQHLEAPLPHGALNLLWRDELFELCGALRVSVGKRATMGPMAAALRWHCTGAELTRGVCAVLRARRCAEADPEIIERIAA